MFVCESCSLTGRGDDPQGAISGVTIHSVLSPLVPFSVFVCARACGCVNKAPNSTDTLLRLPYLTLLIDYSKSFYTV